MDHGVDTFKSKYNFTSYTKVSCKQGCYYDLTLQVHPINLLPGSVKSRL